LPTMATLHTRKPDVYTKPECPFCNRYKETNIHVFLCSEKGKNLKIAQILDTQPHDRFEFNDLLRGLISKSLYRIIRNKVNSAERGKQMIMDIFATWKDILRNNWKKR
ncbi:2644_t:CDS:2, partial [Diversispora eburnea]